MKWAESADKRIAGHGDSRLLISNGLSNRLVHKWRSEAASILVGTNTAILDNPSLTTRLWKGKNPMRLVVDMDLRLPASLHLFNQSVNTVSFNTKKEEELGLIRWVMVKKEDSLPMQILHFLYNQNIQSVFIEGGKKILQSFIDEGLWDEARVITNDNLVIGTGVDAPVLSEAVIQDKFGLDNDTIRIFSSTFSKSF